jgi:hypothetical protein
VVFNRNRGVPRFLVELNKTAVPNEDAIVGAFVPLPKFLSTISFNSNGQLWGADFNAPVPTLYELNLTDGTAISSQPLSRSVRSIHFGCDETLYAGTGWNNTNFTAGAGFFGVINVEKTGDVDVPGGADPIFEGCYVAGEFPFEVEKCGTPIVGISDDCSCPEKCCKTRGHHDPPGEWGHKKKKKKRRRNTRRSAACKAHIPNTMKYTHTRVTINP